MSNTNNLNNESIENGYKSNKKRLVWYFDTYNRLRSYWLFYCLRHLNLPSNFKFASLSSNYGKYEEDVYLSLTEYYGYNPTFYLGDLLSDRNHVRTFDNFFYEYRGKDAKKVELPEKVNVLLDNKGALWYSVKYSDEIDKPKPEDLINLLKKYCSFLNDDTSILIIDGYKEDNRFSLTHLSGFQEKSTYFRMKPLIKKIGLSSIGSTLKINDINLAKEDKYIIRKKSMEERLELHIFTKKELQLLVKKLEFLNKSDPETFLKILHKPTYLRRKKR